MSPSQSQGSESRKSEGNYNQTLLAICCALSLSLPCCELHCMEEHLSSPQLLQLNWSLAYLCSFLPLSKTHISMSWYWMGTWLRILDGNPNQPFQLRPFPSSLYQSLRNRPSKLLFCQDNPSRSFCTWEQRGRMTRISISFYGSSRHWSRAYNWWCGTPLYSI